MKAIITAAGFGTRLYPVTKVVRKEMLPVPGENGLLIPLMARHVVDLRRAGFRQIGIVTQPGETDIFRLLFQQHTSERVLPSLSLLQRRMCDEIEAAGSDIELIPQENGAHGLGAAILSAREWLEPREPFLLILGDHCFQSAKDTPSCLQQFASFMPKVAVESSLLGAAETLENDVHRFGCFTGIWTDTGLLQVSLMLEKPSIEKARIELQVPGFAPGKYLSVFGIYLLASETLSALEDDRGRAVWEKSELQLTPVIDRMATCGLVHATVIQGVKIDIGVPAEYKRLMEIQG